MNLSTLPYSTQPHPILKHRRPAILSVLLPALLLFVAAPALRAADPPPTRATLPNGMRVVIIRNTLAPVVTVEANFMVGGNETPDGFPGMAHAAGAHGLPRLHRHVRRPDRRHLRRSSAATITPTPSRTSRSISRPSPPPTWTSPSKPRPPASAASTIPRPSGTRSAAPSSRKSPATSPTPPINSSTASTPTFSPARPTRTILSAPAIPSTKPPAPCSGTSTRSGTRRRT